MFNILLLKTYIFILVILTKNKSNVLDNSPLLCNFLNLFFHPKLTQISTKDFLCQIKDYLGFYIENENKIQSENLYLDKEILLTCLSLIFKPIGKNIFTVHYEETQEVGYRIPNLVFFSSNNLEEITDFILLDDFLPICTSFINNQWTKSTNGGKFQIKHNQIIFKLAGFKVLDNKHNILNELIPDLPSLPLKKIEEFIENKLPLWNCNKLIDIQTFFYSIWNNLKQLINKSEKIEIKIDPLIPIIKIPEITFSSLLLCACSPFFICTDSKHSALTISYSESNKLFEIETMLKTDKPFVYPDNAYKILNYLIEELKGIFTIEQTQTKTDYTSIINIHVPDNIGIFLDKEIPGWECLSSESKSILYRLGSDCSIPYEHPFISELICFEIENYFHNVFLMPLFKNLAYEVLKKNKNILSPTIKSILEDIAKGKIKKKLLSPEPTGEIIDFFLKLPDGTERMSKLYNTDISLIDCFTALAKSLKEFPASAKHLITTLVFLIQNTKKYPH